jgi:putative two-component system response regulator
MKEQGMKARPHIVFVDDDPDTCKIASTYLRKWGYKAYTADSGEVGLQLIAKHAPVVVFLDMMLPKMRGLDVCSRIKENEVSRATPVVFISAIELFEYVQEAKQRGAEAFLNKPFTAEELRLIVDRLAPQR